MFWDFHGDDTGSNPVGDAKLFCIFLNTFSGNPNGCECLVTKLRVESVYLLLGM
jgi:hypothetical protein